MDRFFIYIAGMINDIIMKIKGIPFKGHCAYCGVKVYHHYPWLMRVYGQKERQPVCEKCNYEMWCD